ncbi:proline-rich protein 7 [Conger conger]|uniref:proline-rich protein 7 n=1 Tax=Conger conger TaxID=82655 RepID=UPI002A59DF79|nr:proline-rich protein 7 [Conger conger]
MVMSQGTYTFLACFAGFWLVWALVVMLCCFCSFLQRRLKRQREERLREHCLHSLQMEPLPHREPPRFCPPHLPLPTAWSSTQGTVRLSALDAFGKPPCYEEAVLMEDPPPPYSEVLGEPRGGMYTKPAPGTSRKLADPEPSKPALAKRPVPSLIRLPSEEPWDPLGRLLSAMDLHRHNLPPHAAPPAPLSPRAGRGRTHSDLGLEAPWPLPTAFPEAPWPLPTAFPEAPWPLPTAFPLLGRSTAV